MKTVICKLDNASATINGIDFVLNEDGYMVATVEDIDADHFQKIPGYEVTDIVVADQDKPGPGRPRKQDTQE